MNVGTVQRTTTVLSASALALAIIVTPAVVAAQGRGVQITPDGKRMLANKDVGAERWAIAKNPDGTLTGNVFRINGDPAFIFCTPLAEPNRYSCSGSDQCSELGGLPRGIQRTPNLMYTLVNKDVGDERWAISLNEDGTATGNVFRTSGSPAFIACTPTGGNDFACSGADACVTDVCIDQYTFIANITLPDDFFDVPVPCDQVFVFIAEVTLPATFFVPPELVTFTVTANASVQGFTLNTTYPTGKGGFSGSADGVGCTSNAGNFVANDLDNGSLLFVVGSATNLTFPIEITCAFDENEGQDVVAGDIGVDVQSVTQNGSAGNTAAVSVGVTIQ
jgi:hypothetical protein